MRIFSGEQGRTRVYNEAYCLYVEKVNPRRTQLGGKKAISGWKLVSCFVLLMLKVIRCQEFGFLYSPSRLLIPRMKLRMA